MLSKAEITIYDYDGAQVITILLNIENLTIENEMIDLSTVEHDWKELAPTGAVSISMRGHRCDSKSA